MLSTLEPDYALPSDSGLIDAAMDGSPLGRLPGELRNMIYELVLVQDTPIGLKLRSAGRKKARVRSFQKNSVGLLFTCKAIYRETRFVLYEGNIFIIRTDLKHLSQAVSLFRYQIGSSTMTRLGKLLLSTGWLKTPVQPDKV